MTTELLTFRQVADELGCSVRTVKRRVAAGELPVVQDGPRLRWVRRVDLERWITERLARRTTSQPAVVRGRRLPPGERLWS